MPMGDGTGPLGQGPRTGRGLGNCPPAQPGMQNQNVLRPVPGYTQPTPQGGGFGRGFGRGRVRGRGMGRGFGGPGVGLGQGF